MDTYDLCGVGEEMERDLVNVSWTPRPLVTVLMAVYETPGEYLQTATTSILQQTFEDFEFLVLDDGSKDATTLDHLRDLAACDRRVRLLRHENMGLTRTLNRGLELARGEWIARQDSDDWSDTHRLTRQLQFLRDHADVQLCGANAWMHQQDGRLLWSTRLPEDHEEILRSFQERNPFVHGAVMFRASRARELGGYREQFRCSQDFDFFWRFTECNRTANLRDALYHYRFTNTAISATKAAVQSIAHRAAHKLAAMRRAGMPEDMHAAFKQARRELSPRVKHHAALKQADHSMLAGEYRAAGRVFGNLLRTRPWSVMAWAKLARWAVFASVPLLRRECFR